MIMELARLAGREGATRIVVPAGCDAAPLLQACGFHESVEDQMLIMKITPEEEL